ncbi:SDR family NAD(P)-dependent oxidoreductase [Streptomyces sp. NPDC004059]
MTNIAGSAVLITGGNRGIGRALVAEALARGAARVYAGTRGPLDHPDGRVTPLHLDVTDADRLRRAAEEVGSLDVLVNNAGIAVPDELDDRTALERHLAVNRFGTYDVIRAFLPLLLRSEGAIVNNLSLNSLAALPLLRGVRGAGRPRRCGEGRGGHLPRPAVGVPGRGLARRRGEGPGTAAGRPACGTTHRLLSRGARAGGRLTPPPGHRTSASPFHRASRAFP